MNIGYVRVSTIDQNEQRQIEGLEKHNIQKWYIEKVSGKSLNRPQLAEMLDFVRESDTVFIHDLSRLARNTKDLLELIEFFKSKNVNLVSNKENIDTNTPTGQLMITMIAAINEFERNILLERQREGIAIAKRNKKYKGRKEITIDNKVFQEQYAKYLRRELTKSQLAACLKISRPTLNKILNKKQKEQP